jgi:hypothetical protein
MSVAVRPSRLSAVTDIGQLEFQGPLTGDALTYQIQVTKL